jgi:hypothetical protein
VIDEWIFADVAALVKVPVEAIQHFDEEKAVNKISNTFNNGSILNGINIFQFSILLKNLFSYMKRKLTFMKGL